MSHIHEGYVIYDVVKELWLEYNYSASKFQWTTDYHDRYVIAEATHEPIRIVMSINGTLKKGMERSAICVERLRLGEYVLVPLIRIGGFPRVPDFSCVIELAGYVNDRFLK